MSFPAVARFLNAHRPRGLTLSGSGSISDSGVVTSRSLGWDEPNRSYAVGLELDLQFAPAGHGTVIRADGIGEWLDPRPVRDTERGVRVRVTVAGGCPARDKGVIGVRNTAHDLSASLLPRASSPTSALICQYGGLNPPDVLRLHAHVLVSATGAGAIAKQVLNIPLAHTDGGVINCPMDDGEFDVIAFHYRNRPDVDLAVHPRGCSFVSNDYILAAGGPDLSRYITPISSL